MSVLLAFGVLSALGASRAHAQDAAKDTAPAPAPAVAATPAPAASGPSLQGLWILDEKASDPAPQFGGGGGGGGGRRGGGGGGGGGWGGGGGRHGGGMGGGMGGGEMGGRPEGGPPDGGPPEGGDGGQGGGAGGDEGRGGRRMGPAQKLIIDQVTDHIEVSEDNRPARIYLLGDAAAPQVAPENAPPSPSESPAHAAPAGEESAKGAAGQRMAPPPVHAKWQGRTLVAARSMGDRGTITERYSLAKDGKTLTVTREFTGGERAMPVRKLVYRLYDGN